MINTFLKFFIIAGEPSGDMHGGKLIREIKKINPNSSFMGHGGNEMKDAGMKIFEHTENLSIMGFFEVVKHLPKILKILNETSKVIEKTKPDRVILIDYPGFNLRLAKKISRLNIPVTYFILPQAWAWNESRVNLMKSYINQSISIFRFEHIWYSKKGLNVDYFGHPLAEIQHVNESSKSFYKRHNINISDSLLVLLPGSRQQEVDKHWPVFLETIIILKDKYPDLKFMVAKSQDVKLGKTPDFLLVETDSKKAIIAATAAIASSGTATLECAVEQTPLVVCYKLSNLSWAIAKKLSKVKYSSIVNLIADKEVLPELLQEKMNAKNIIEKISPLLERGSKEREKMLLSINKIRNTIGPRGVYIKSAEAIIKNTIDVIK